MKTEGLLNDPYYLALLWFKIPIYLDILRRGFTIIKSDSDIGYTGKDIWKAFELMAEKTGADLIFMKENPINGGHFYAIPRDRVIAFFEEWLASEKFNSTYNDQQALETLNNKVYRTCISKTSCDSVKKFPMSRNSSVDVNKNARKYRMVAILTYPSPFSRYGDICPPNISISPCDTQTLYVHTICMTSSQLKIKKLKQLGFWLMSDTCAESQIDIPLNLSGFANISIIRCVPIPRLWVTAESAFLNCNHAR
jgi:hypothetical protein